MCILYKVHIIYKNILYTCVWYVYEYIQYVTYIDLSQKQTPSPNTFKEEFYPNNQGRHNPVSKQANYRVGGEGIN